MNLSEITNYFNTKQKAFEDLLHRLVSLSTYSGRVSDINSFQDVCIELFEPFHPQVKRVQTKVGDIVVFDFLPETKEKIIMLAHIDTVQVTEQATPPRIEDGRLYGNGCYDMKSAVALFFFVRKAIREFKLSPSRGMKIILTPDEETGSTFSMDFLIDECRDAAGVLVPEPCCPDGSIKTRRKGVLFFNAILTGKAAHSGVEPEKGKDANRGLMELIREIDKRMEKYSDVTFNPGIITGGVRINVVSPESLLEGEFRSHSNSTLESIAEELDQIQRIGNIHVSVSARMHHPALEFDDKNKKLFQVAQKVASQLNVELSTCSSGGASDGSTLSSKGISVLDGIGIRGGDAHSKDEFVELTDFPFRAAFLTGLSLEI